jgi:uncharacterized protein (DUF1684 family)
MSEYLDLYDYRCRNADLYRERKQAYVAGDDDETILQRFREGKDALFNHHSQSPLDEAQRDHFQGLRYFPYNPAMRFVVPIDTTIEPTELSVAMNAYESMTMTTMGRVNFIVDGSSVSLSIYWLDIYSGGLFLPFRDTTCPAECYGGGRYLFDTIKGSDFLPARDGRENYITLDFNYAYNPSCAYNSRWFCPLAPSENQLKVAIPAGEKKYPYEEG